MFLPLTIMNWAAPFRAAIKVVFANISACLLMNRQASDLSIGFHDRFAGMMSNHSWGWANLGSHFFAFD